MTGGSGARAGVVVAAMAYVLAVLALAGPSWRQADQPLWQTQRPLVVVLDLSSRITAAGRIGVSEDDDAAVAQQVAVARWEWEGGATRRGPERTGAEGGMP